MESRKGLSGVITTVLLILLILVAIGIIWAFLSPFISDSGEGLEGSTACLGVSLAPVNCVNASGTYTVSVERGGDNEELAEIKLIFYEAGGDTNVISNRTVLPGQLETRAYAFSSTTTYTEVAVGKTIVIGEGQEYVCEQISERLDCQ